MADVDQYLRPGSIDPSLQEALGSGARFLLERPTGREPPSRGPETITALDLESSGVFTSAWVAAADISDNDVTA